MLQIGNKTAEKTCRKKTFMRLTKHLLVLLTVSNICFAQGLPTCSTVTDVDGNVYQTVVIGKQVWTTENLRTTKFNDSSAIPLVQDSAVWCNRKTSGYCYYDNTKNVDSIKKYGALYNWYTINTGKLAPVGWHIPDTTDWNILEDYLIKNGYNWDRTKSGNKIAKSMAAKNSWEISTNHGDIGNDLTKNNRCGFSALPGGGRNIEARFQMKGMAGIWWSATECDSIRAYSRSLINLYHEALSNTITGKMLGCSCRLVKD